MSKKRRGRMVSSRLDEALSYQAQQVFRARYKGQPVWVVPESELRLGLEHVRGAHEEGPYATAATD